MTVTQTNTMQQKPMITDIFVQGARKGFDIATKAMIPNLIMAFVLIKALNVTGLLDLIGRVCAPVMELFGPVKRQRFWQAPGCQSGAAWVLQQPCMKSKP